MVTSNKFKPAPTATRPCQRMVLLDVSSLDRYLRNRLLNLTGFFSSVAGAAADGVVVVLMLRLVVGITGAGPRQQGASSLNGYRDGLGMSSLWCARRQVRRGAVDLVAEWFWETGGQSGESFSSV